MQPQNLGRIHEYTLLIPIGQLQKRLMQMAKKRVQIEIYA